MPFEAQETPAASDVAWNYRSEANSPIPHLKSIFSEIWVKS